MLLQSNQDAVSHDIRVYSCSTCWRCIPQTALHWLRNPFPNYVLHSGEWLLWMNGLVDGWMDEEILSTANDNSEWVQPDQTDNIGSMTDTHSQIYSIVDCTDKYCGCRGKTMNEWNARIIYDTVIIIVVNGVIIIIINIMDACCLHCPYVIWFALLMSKINKKTKTIWHISVFSIFVIVYCQLLLHDVQGKMSIQHDEWDGWLVDSFSYLVNV